MTTNLNLTSAPASSLDVDAIVIGVLSTDSGPRPAPGAEDLDQSFDGRLADILRTLGAEGKAGEVTKLHAPAGAGAPLVVAAGLGSAGNGTAPDAETLRRAAGTAVRALAGSASAALALPAPTAAEVEAIATGALLGNYSYERYRTGERKSPVGAITILAQAGGGGDTDQQAGRQALHRAGILADAVHLVRDLVNTPPADLCPADFASVAERIATETGLAIEVLEEKALTDAGYGGITGVGQGSARPPRLVRLAYTHPEAERTVTLVGKGITFDTGGLSLKPADSMDWMKSDMGGAGAVLGALKAIAGLAPKVNVIGYLPMAENMPSGTAQRPSDVLTIYGGKTVEVLNTDAEGRLILADALVRAVEDAPDLLVDVATLTGAQMVALGTRTAGVMANDDDVREKVVAAATQAGEASWPMPLPEELRKGLDSAVADIANISSDRWGGMLAAGVFLREFVPAGVRWAHIDIAGPAFHKGEPYGYTPKGGTGAATRTLVQIAEDVAAGRL